MCDANNGGGVGRVHTPSIPITRAPGRAVAGIGAVDAGIATRLALVADLATGAGRLETRAVGLDGCGQGRGGAGGRRQDGCR